MKKLLFLALIVYLILRVCSCNSTIGNSVNDNSEVIDTTAANNPLQKSSDNSISPQNKNKPEKNQQLIRKIDFKNFTYPWFPKYIDNHVIKKKIVLKNGKNPEKEFNALPFGGPQLEIYQEYLGNVTYADLTGDGKEEAIVTVGVEFYKWNPMCIFIYAEEKRKAKLLWTYELNAIEIELDWRGHKIKDGNLIIEEYFAPSNDNSNCCPTKYFTRTFAWDGETFQEKSMEIIPYDYKKEGKKVYSGFPSDNSSD